MGRFLMACTSAITATTADVFGPTICFLEPVRIICRTLHVKEDYGDRRLNKMVPPMLNDETRRSAESAIADGNEVAASLLAAYDDALARLDRLLASMMSEDNATRARIMARAEDAP